MLYHTASIAQPIQEFRTAFAKSIVLAIENGSNEVAVTLHDKADLKGNITEALGKIADKLDSGTSVSLGDVKVYLETEKAHSSFRSGIILASRLSDEQLGNVLTDSRATDVIFVPRDSAALDQYLQQHRSTQL